METYETQKICAYISIVIIMLMIIVMAGSFMIQWPHMPVDPRTIAGAMFYVCDSWMLGSLDGLASLERRDRDWMVKSMGLRYLYGNLTGMSEKERVGIDAIDDADDSGVSVHEAPAPKE
jgi:hypothetical protein